MSSRGGDLRRRLGLGHLFFVSVGAIIGSAWLFAPLFAAQAAGPGALVAWLISGGAALLRRRQRARRKGSEKGAQRTAMLRQRAAALLLCAACSAAAAPGANWLLHEYAGTRNDYTGGL